MNTAAIAKARGKKGPRDASKAASGGRGAGEPDEDGRVQSRRDYGCLAKREQAEAVDVAVEDAQRDDALRAEIGSMMTWWIRPPKCCCSLAPRNSLVR